MLTVREFLSDLRKARGLGDAVAATTRAIGIRPCAGCKHRQTILNKRFPISRPRAPKSPT